MQARARKMPRRVGLALVGSLAVAASAIVAAQTSSRTQRPEMGPPPSTIPAIEKRQLSNGLPVWIVEQHGLPVVQMSLQVLTGADADPPGLFGIASLTAAMLTEGAGARSAVEIADRLDELLANLTATATADASSVQLYVPAAQLADALSLMADVSQRPTFPSAELDRVRRRLLVSLLNGRGDPDAVAAQAFARSVYGPSHRNAAGPFGTAASLEALTPDRLRRFHASTYRPANSTLLVVGDVEPDRVLRLLEQQFGTWQPAGTSGGEATSQGALRQPPALQRPARQLAVVDLPNAPQSRVLVGSVAASGSMADFFPLQVLNTILRGRFASGRHVTLRDFTTGVRSGFEMRKSARPFVVSVAVQADKTADALRELHVELTAALNDVPPDELARAQDGIARQFATAFEASGRISSRLQSLESLVVYDLPTDYYATYVSAVRAVTAADVQRVAREYLQPAHLVVVVVGDRTVIAPALRALDVGPVRELSVDDVFGPPK